MPGTEKTTPIPQRPPIGCSFRTQQGAVTSPTSRTTDHRSTRPEMAVLEVLAVAGIRLASVSACEHPTTTSGQCGLLDRLPGLGAP